MREIIRKFFDFLSLFAKFSKKRNQLEQPAQQVVRKSAREEKAEEIKRYRSKITLLTTRIDLVSNAIVRRQLRVITKCLEDILNYIEKDDQKMTVSKQVFIYHVDSLKSILDKYIKLSQNSEDVNELIEFSEQVRSVFETSINFLNEFFLKMKEQEVDSLKLEIDFFRQLQL